jgi:non-specific serine/threonine protein kinase
LQVLAELEPRFADGTGIISLVAVRDPALVLKEIARELGLHDAGDRPVIAHLGIALRDRELLLGLDNLEQAIEAGSDLAELLTVCPGLTMLVTSRERLRVSAEQEYPLQPLSVPEVDRMISLDELADVGAVALFVRRASAVRPAFALTHDNARIVSDLCIRLDGLPLAIELAAARVNMFSLDALLTRLDHRFELLTDGARDLPQRQQTMWNAVAWSYDLLDPGEQALFRRLSVFTGGVTLEAVEAVASPADAPAGIDPVAGIASLVEKSLLDEDDRAGISRYVMLETVRQFGAAQLDRAGETEQTRQRHATWYRDLVATAFPALSGRVERQWLQRLRADNDNIRKAFEWALDRPDAEFAQWMAYLVSWYWYARGNLDEGRHWLSRALACPGSSTLEARSSAAVHAAWVAAEQGDFAGGTALAEEGLAMAHEAGNRLAIAQSFYVQGMVAIGERSFDSAQTLLERSLVAYEEAKGDAYAPFALKSLGYLAHRRQDYERSKTLFNQALAAFRQLGNAFGVTTTLLNMAKAARDRHDLARATALYLEALALHPEHGDNLSVASCLRGLGITAALGNQDERAIRLLGAEAALRASIGAAEPRSSSWRTALADARRQVGEAEFERAWSAGQALSLAEAIAEAQAVSEEVAGSSATVDRFDLTIRERQVLRLLTAGHSNPEIAESLFISRRTVTTHITNLYAKLGVDNRVAAVGEAHRRGLLDLGPT